jgi:hypothetical protein
MFYDSQFRHSSNIKVISSAVLEAVVLVLLMRGIYEMCDWDDYRWHNKLTKFHTDHFRCSEVGVWGGMHTHACYCAQQGNLISPLLFSQIKKSVLKMQSICFRKLFSLNVFTESDSDLWQWLSWNWCTDSSDLRVLMLCILHTSLLYNTEYDLCTVLSN